MEGTRIMYLGFIPRFVCAYASVQLTFYLYDRNYDNLSVIEMMSKESASEKAKPFFSNSVDINFYL